MGSARNRPNHVVALVKLTRIVQIHVAAIELDPIDLADIGSIVGYRSQHVEYVVVPVNNDQKERFWMEMVSGHSICLDYQ